MTGVIIDVHVEGSREKQDNHMVNKPVSRLFRHLNRAYYTRGFSRTYNKAGIDVMEQDWDVLLLLDGCRADTFEKINYIPGEYKQVTSRGAMTREFLYGNFEGRKFLDTVYVTANPMYQKHQDDLGTTFYDVVDIWEENGWDSTHNTVLPETVVDYGSRIAEEYKDKRILVHFMQPHYPFVSGDVDIDAGTPDPHTDTPGFWYKIRMGKIDVNRERLIKAYERNLELVLSHVERLVDDLYGKVVVTSDHGNLFGERIGPLPHVEWGHPAKLYVEGLVSVPWLEIPSKERREVKLADRTKEQLGESNEIEQRLRHLGYKT